SGGEEIGISRKYSPASTGESTSISRDTGLKLMLPAFCEAVSSAVPNFQLAGSLRLGVTLMSAEALPEGYISTSFQLTITNFSLVLAPAEKPSAAAVATKSIATLTEVAPAGTLTWSAYISTSSRVHCRGWPLAEMMMPAVSTIGPVGPCSP